MVEINGNGEKKWRKWLFNEISLFTGVIAIIISIMFWIQNPIQELREQLNEQQAEHIIMRAEIKAIETKTIALDTTLSANLISLQVQLDRVEARQIEVLKGLAELQAIHKQ
jgi:hypothetical protein